MPVLESRIEAVRRALRSLVDVQLDLLRIPSAALIGFEPSQIGTIAGALMDASLPQLELLLPGNDLLADVGLRKAPGLLGDREGYPDYEHASGVRLELKLLYVDPQDGLMKDVATRREPSARLTQKVTVKNVRPEDDLLMVVAYQLRASKDDPNLFSPTILDIGLFSIDECIAARDHRLHEAGGRWFGDYETPAVLSRAGKDKLQRGLPLDETTYGRKESEGRDYNEDTNFGKLKRIPLKALQEFLRRHGANYSSSGTYPSAWRLPRSSSPLDDAPLDAAVVDISWPNAVSSAADAAKLPD